MGEFVTVAKVAEIPPGAAAAFAVRGRMVGVFNVDGQFRAIDDICPHMGASLATGGIHEGIVVCPWHAWRFDTCSGAWCDNPRIKIDVFEVRVAEGEIQVRVTDEQARE